MISFYDDVIVNILFVSYYDDFFGFELDVIDNRWYYYIYLFYLVD